MEKTHWKKNNDSAFISGEDLVGSLNGLKPEMVVSISRFLDAETFDQNKQSKRVVTGLFLKDQSGKEIYKPAILNKTNAKFFVKETGSDYVDDWVGRPVILFAQKDSRHGHVVRFRKYSKPELILNSKEFIACKKAYHADNSVLMAIQNKYQVSAEVENAILKKEEANG